MTLRAHRFRVVVDAFATVLNGIIAGLVYPGHFHWLPWWIFALAGYGALSSVLTRANCIPDLWDDV